MAKKYKVNYVNLTANRNDSADKVALQLENAIQQMENQGWNFESVETLEFWVAGTGGCFGLGAKPGYTTSMQMIIFSQSGS